MTRASNPAAPEAAIPRELEPGLRLLRAPNPSPMTERGTNTYLLGTRGIAVIDPGPENPAHLAAIEAALAPGQRITHVLVTHAHLDHSPLARPLAERHGAQVWAFGRAEDGRSPVMARLAAEGLAGGGEGLDAAFRPDQVLRDGDEVTGEDWRLTALHTPGHMGCHLSFAWGDALFSGDLVMGWASSMVSPPDGDLAQFLASCTRLRQRDWRVFYPGHGDPVTDPAGRIDWLVAHRKSREAEIRTALDAAPGTARELAARIYTDVPEGLLGAAARNVFAHLVDLSERGLAAPEGPLSGEARFAPATPAKN